MTTECCEVPCKWQHTEPKYNSFLCFNWESPKALAWSSEAHSPEPALSFHLEEESLLFLPLFCFLGTLSHCEGVLGLPMCHSVLPFGLYAFRGANFVARFAL